MTKLDHAEHNFELCEKLLNEEKYFDWVITTAFYSSIHFIDEKVFDFEYNNHIYESIEQAHRSSLLKGASRHQTRRNIVEISLRNCLNDYNELDKACRSARYTNYKVSKRKANDMFDRLKNIKKSCED